MVVPLPAGEAAVTLPPPGALPAASLEQVIKAVRELDMAEVRQQTAPRTNA